MHVKFSTSESFAELRQEGAYYADKTEFLVDFLVGSSSKVTLFTRPRRFGKTLFLSMIADFFDSTKDSRELFRGLKVAEHEKLCNDWMNQYPVVFISLKDVDSLTYEGAVDDVRESVRNACDKHEYLLQSDKISKQDKELFLQLYGGEPSEKVLRSALRILTSVLTKHHGKKCILLIDEYDVPVMHAVEENFYKKMINFMRVFLTRGLKTNDDYLLFSIITGVMRIVKESIFSGLNNIISNDISSTKYASIFGFTQKEIDNLLAINGITEQRDIIKVWYDGYRFGKCTEIYCPWSIASYCENLKVEPDGKPRPYWVNTSSNDLAREFIIRLADDENTRRKLYELLGGNAIAARLNLEMNYNDVWSSPDNLWTILFLTGYLTEAEDPSVYPEETDANQSILAVPNKEVNTVFQNEMEAWLGRLLPENRRQALYDAIWQENASAVEEVLTGLLTGSGVRDQKEAYYHGMMYGIMCMRYDESISNGEGGKGYFDILVRDRKNSRAAVFELKRAPAAGELEKFAQNALKQIEDRAYDARLRAEGSCKKLLHVGIAFCEKAVKVLVRDASDRG